MPVWILGSSTESAYLAAELGLPYAFASHFAPAQMMAAFQIYARLFKPSKQLQEPYTLACLSIIAAESNEEAKFLATSMYQSYLGIITGSRSPMKPPITVDEMEKFWTPQQKAAVQQMTLYSMIGDKKYLSENLDHFIAQTGIKELMTITQVYELDKKHRSMEIIADVMQSL